MINAVFLDNRDLRRTVTPHGFRKSYNVTYLSLLHVPNTPDFPRAEFWLIHESLLNAYVWVTFNKILAVNYEFWGTEHKTADAYWRKGLGIFLEATLETLRKGLHYPLSWLRFETGASKIQNNANWFSLAITSISAYYFTPIQVMKMLRNLVYRQYNPIWMTHLESTSSLFISHLAARFTLYTIRYEIQVIKINFT
jgi:hypothetical protein